MTNADAPDFSDLHPLTHFLGVAGPLLIGPFSVAYIALRYSNAPSELIDLTLNLVLIGFTLFILGALTIPLQTRYLD